MKKTVADDALISTDIDSIIHYLSSRKRVEMSALARQLGMKPEALKKWVGILEDEGYVRVEYHLLNEFVVWAGAEMVSDEEVKSPAPETEKRPQDFFGQPDYVPREQQAQEAQRAAESGKPAEPQFSPDSGSASETGKEGKGPATKPELPEPEHEEFRAAERVESIMDRINKRHAKEDITDSILSSFAEEGKHEGPSSQSQSGAPDSGSQQPSSGGTGVIGNIRDRRGIRGEKHGFRQEQKPEPREQRNPEAEKARDELFSLKRSLSEYMEQIRVQREDIEKLKAEREHLLAKAYIPMEGRFKNAFENIADRMLEKENRIIELKERLLELPNKLEGADRSMAALGRIREELKTVLGANREEMEKLKKTLISEDSRIKSEIEAMEKEVKSRKAEVVDLSGSVSTIESKEQELKKGVESLNKHLAEINEGIAASYASLANLSHTRSEISARLESIRMALDAKTGEVSASYARLSDVRKAESVINEYLSDYQKKIAEVEQYAGESEKELAKLREFAEIKYMRGYLKELESVSSAYDHEYEAAAAQEQSIGERIREAKGSLEELIKESRSLVKAIEKKTSGKDFDALLNDVKARQEEMVATMSEKSAELEKVESEFPQHIKKTAEEKMAQTRAAKARSAPARKEKGGKKKRKK